MAESVRASLVSTCPDRVKARRKETSLKRWGVLFVMALIVVGGGLVYLTRQQERALAAVEQLLTSGDVATAMREVSAYQRQYPTDSRVLALRARLLLKMGRPREAAQLFEQHGAATVADLSAWAQAYLMQSQWSLAAPILRRSLQLAPTDTNALYNLMVCDIRLGLLQDALKLGSELARLPSHAVVGHWYLGTIHNDLKNEEQAVVEFAEVLRLDPELRGLPIPPEQFLSEYGGTLLSMGRSNEAIPLLRRSLEIRSTAAAATTLGQAFLHRGETAQAVAHWELAVKLDPRTHRAREGLADIALREGDTQQALEWLKPLEDSNKLESATAFLMQRIFQRLGDVEKAATWQVRANQLRRKREVESAVDRLLVESPSSYWSQIVRAYRVAESGNWSEAQRLLQQVHDGDSPHEFVQQLQSAVKTRGPLPSLDEIPIRLF